MPRRGVVLLETVAAGGEADFNGGWNSSVRICSPMRWVRLWRDWWVGIS